MEPATIEIGALHCQSLAQPQTGEQEEATERSVAFGKRIEQAQHVL